jgi:hypothetical protein
LRSFGLDITRGTAVIYRVRIPSLGLDGLTVAGEAFERAEVALPALSAGTHEVTIEAEAAGLRDAIVRPLRVIDSRLRRAEASYAELGGGEAPAGAADRRTRVVFSDHNRGRYYDDVARLGWTYGDRVDQMLARALGRELLTEFFDAPADEADPRFVPSLYQTQDGGIGIFPYADDDLLLSARVASVAGDRFSRDALQQYFGKIIDDPKETRERALMALWGTASTGAPVLPSIQRVAVESGLTLRERLYVGLAALAAGDETVACEMYTQVLLEAGEQRAPFVRIRTGVDQDDILEATALAADLAAGLGDGSAPAMFEYTTQNYTKDLLVELDQVSFLARSLPRLPAAPVEFSYNLRGERQEQTLAAGQTLTLSLTPDELASLDAQVIEGAVGIATFYEVPFDVSAATKDPDISVRRTIVGNGDGDGIQQGEIVEVRLDYEIGPQALDGCYQISDLTPSGLRPISSARDPRIWGAPDVNGNRLSPYLVDGQRVSFCAGRIYNAYYPAVYYARVVTPGEYVAEPAIIQSQQSAESFSLTGVETVVVE